MTFQQPNSRELQNRKILEELQLKKQMLLKQGVQQSLGSSLNIPSIITSSATSQQSGDGANMTSMQRAALLNAHAHSTGYFITQESSFGNLILPVLPRFNETSTTK
ncbi:SOSS complex subunit C-like [Copidosoma floridanum]|uniref:SOSS complex subunit C n=1 Tax=Copidosoma floridanum TaxID=29053 RepID=UPI0006C9BF66|nr:SOSS complex subunit C [Copidosoma floridanum]XP_023245120.1 SOSS complex subunit C-like [Copidosoma floridanum]